MRDYIVNWNDMKIAKFASVTYDEVKLSGPAAAPLGFPAPRGELNASFYIWDLMLSFWIYLT